MIIQYDMLLITLLFTGMLTLIYIPMVELNIYDKDRNYSCSHPNYEIRK
jgi:hypothetical protein